MIEIGKINKLTVIDENASGHYLTDKEESEELFLPPALTHLEVKLKDEVEVFAYLDTTGSLIGTTRAPVATLDGIGCMKAIEITEHGAFMDWGLDKDLLVPINEQKNPIKMNEYYIVKVCLDQNTERLFGSTKLGQYIQASEFDIEEREEVKIIPVIENDFGYRCIVNGKYVGIIYHNEIFKKVTVAKEYTAYLKNIRPDKLLDISLQEIGARQLFSSKDIILDYLTKHGGSSPLWDKSSPDEIKKELGMSKQNFKKTIGMLYKDRKIEISSTGIKLISR